MTTQFVPTPASRLTTRLAAFAIAMAVNGLMIGGTAYLFNAQPNAAATGTTRGPLAAALATI